MNVIGVGDNVCDKYRNLNIMYPGGQALNFAVYCKQMGYNASYFGVFGDDHVAKHIINTLNELEVDISRCKMTQGENGYAIVELVNGDRVFVTSNKGGVLKSNPIIFSPEDLEYLKNFQIIHSSNNSYIDNELEKLKSLDALISYDFSTSWDYKQSTYDICRNIDFAFMSCSNLSEEEIKKRLIDTYDLGTKVIVATRGTEGSIVFDGKNFFFSKPNLVEAVDTLGAGDSFAAALTTSYFLKIGKKRDDGLNTEEYAKLVNQCLQIANDMSAMTCMTMGAFGHGTKIED